MVQRDPVLEQLLFSRMRQAVSDIKMCRFGRVHATHVRCFDRGTREFCREIPVVKEFNEDQERDERGRWTDGGQGGLPGVPQGENPQPTDMRVSKNGEQQEFGKDGDWHTLPVEVDRKHDGWHNGTVEVQHLDGTWEKIGQVDDEEIRDEHLYKLNGDGKWEDTNYQVGDQRTGPGGHQEHLNDSGHWSQDTFTPESNDSRDQSNNGSGDNRGTGQGGFAYSAPDSAPAEPGAGRLEDHPEQAALREKAITEFELKGTRDDHVNPAYKVTFEDGTQAMWKPGPYYQIGSYNLPDGDNVHEQAASDLAHMMKYDDIVPHSVIRTVDGVEGSMQEWRNGDHGSRGISVLDAKRSLAFDYMQGNFDRHPHNVLTTPEGKPVLIDNGFSMPGSNTDRHGQSALGLRTAFGVNTDSKIPASVAKAAQHVLDSWEKSAKQLQRNGLSDSALNAMKERITAVATHKGSWQTLPHMQFG